MAFRNYRERSYEKGATESASSVADTIITDLKGQGLSLGSIDFYSSRFTLIVISKKGDTDDTIIVGQSTTFPDRLSIKVDDTVSEDHRADSIGYIDEDVNGGQTFKLFDEDGSLAALKAALLTAAEGDVEKVTLRVSPTLTPEYTNPKFKGGSVSFADLNLEGKRQDLIVLRMEESRGLFGSRDTTADPIRVDTSFPSTDTIRREGELFVLTHEDGGTTTQSEGLYVSQEYETDDLDADGNKIKAFRWIYATDPERTAALFAVNERYDGDTLNADSGTLTKTEGNNYLQWLIRSGNVLRLSDSFHEKEWATDNVADVEIRGFGDIRLVTQANLTDMKVAFELITWDTGTIASASETVLAATDVVINSVTATPDNKTIDYNIPVRDFVSASVPSADLQGKQLGIRVNIDGTDDAALANIVNLRLRLHLRNFHVVVSQQHLHLYGSPGPSGPAGEVGPAGPAGEQGETGERGNRGSQGATGRTGPRGLQGLSGSSGRPGPKGDKGDTGETGPAGQDGQSGTGIEHLEAHTETTILNGEPDFEHERTPPFRSPLSQDGFGSFSFFFRNKTQPVQILNIPDSYRTMPGNIPFTYSNMLPAYDLSRNVTSTQETADGFTTFNYAHIRPEQATQQITTGVPLTGVSARNRLAKSANLFFKHGTLYGIGKDFSIAASSEDKFRFYRYTYDDTTTPDSPFIKVFTGGQDGRFGRHTSLVGADNSNTNMGVAPVVLEHEGEHYVVRSQSPGVSTNITVSKINSTPNRALSGVFELGINAPGNTINLTDGGIDSLGVSLELHNQVKSWVVGRSFVWIITTLGYYKVPIETFFNPPTITPDFALNWRTTLYHGEPARTSGAPQPTLAQQSKAGFILDETHEYIALQADPGASDFNLFYGRRFGLSHGAFSEIEFTDSSNDDALITKTDLPVGVISEITANYGRMELHVEENIGGRVNTINADITPIMQGLSLTGIAHDTRNFRSIPVLPRSSALPGSVSANASAPAVANFDIENDVLTISEFTPTNGTPILTRHFNDYIGDLIKMEFDTTGELFGAFFIDNIISRHETTRAGGVVHDLTLKIAHMRMNFGTNDRKTDFAIAFRSTTRIHFVPMQQRVVDISEYQKKSEASGGVDITYGTAHPNGLELGQYYDDFVFTTGGSAVIVSESDDPAVSTTSVQNPQRVMQTSTGHPAVLWGNGDNLEVWISTSTSSADQGFPVNIIYPSSIVVTVDDDGTPRAITYLRSGLTSQQSATVQEGGGRPINVNTQNYTRDTSRTPSSSSIITNISSTGGHVTLSVSKGNVVGEENDLYAHLLDDSKVDALYAYRGTLWEKLSNPGRPSHRSVSVPIKAYTGTGRRTSLRAQSSYTMYTKAVTTGQQENLIEDNFWTNPESSEPPPHTPSSSSLAYPKKAYLWAYVPCKSETHNLSGKMSIDVRTRVAPGALRSDIWERKLKLRYEYYAIGEKTGVPLFTKTSERHVTYTGVVEGDEIITEFSQDQSGGFDEKNIRCKIDLAKYFTVPDLAKTQGVLIKIYLGSAIRTADYTTDNNFLRTEDTVLFPTGNGFTFNYEDPEE